MQAVIASLKKRAIEGHMPSIKLLLTYTVGKPTAAENPDALDQQEFKMMVGNTLDSSEGAINIVKGMPVDLLVRMMRLLLPALRTKKAELAKAVLTAPLTEEEIEDNEDDDCAAEDSKEAAGPAWNPLDNIPDWMLDIGKETVQPSEASLPPTASQPSEPTVDVELLRQLLERARSQTAQAGPMANGEIGKSADPHVERQKPAKGGRPSANGSNGKHPPSANGKK
jgi:hypothetical protein